MSTHSLAFILLACTLQMKQSQKYMYNIGKICSEMFLLTGFQDEEEKLVMVKDTPTKIRNIFLEDQSLKKVKVCLWRSTSTEIRTGDHVQVTDVVINNYKNEISLNTTYTTTVTVSKT